MDPGPCAQPARGGRSKEPGTQGSRNAKTERRDVPVLLVPGKCRNYIEGNGATSAVSGSVRKAPAGRH